MDIKLDPTKHDLKIVDGDLSLIKGGAETEQSLKIALRFFKGEWFIDQRVGVAFFERIFGAGKDPVVRDAEIKREILATDGVEELLEFSVDVDPSTRTYLVDFTVRSDQGEEIETVFELLELDKTTTITQPSAPTNAAPTASFTFSPSSVKKGETINLDASGSSDPEGDALTYAWTITDPSSNTTSLSGETPSFTIDESGTWTIDLTVTDTGGLTDDASDTVVVSPYQLVADTNPDLLVPLLYASTDADGQILYEDDGVTPVQSSGDPISTVYLDGTRRARQPTDAFRPLWQGQGNGAVGDGNDDELLLDSLVSHESLLFATSVEILDFANISFFWGGEYANGTCGCYVAGSGKITWNWRTSAGSFKGVQVAAATGRHVILCELTASDELHLYVDDPVTPAASTTGVTGDSLTPSFLRIFSRSDFDGDEIVGVFTAYEGAKTASDRTDIHDALADGWMP